MLFFISFATLVEYENDYLGNDFFDKPNFEEILPNNAFFFDCNNHQVQIQNIGNIKNKVIYEIDKDILIEAITDTKLNLKFYKQNDFKVFLINDHKVFKITIPNENKILFCTFEFLQILPTLEGLQDNEQIQELKILINQRNSKSFQKFQKEMNNWTVQINIMNIKNEINKQKHKIIYGKEEELEAQKEKYFNLSILVIIALFIITFLICSKISEKKKLNKKQEEKFILITILIIGAIWIIFVLILLSVFYKKINNERTIREQQRIEME